VIKPGGKYFVTRSGGSGSSLIAFAVGKLWEPGNPFAIIATHVDSPCLKLKPISGKDGAGFQLLGVETYGGGLWHTWFDRDLGVAGRAYVRTGPTTIESQLVRLDEALIRVPSLAVHYERQNPFKFSTEHQLVPVTSQKGEEIPASENHEIEAEKVFGPWSYAMSSAKARHPDLLVKKLAAGLDTHPDNILDVDLSLYDVQKATLGGLNNEFIYSARIDNLLMSFCALKSFTKSLDTEDALDEEKSVRTLVMFDHEEIGSEGPIGAKSTFLPRTLQRISALQPSKIKYSENEPASIITNTPYEQAIARSFLISADVHHGKHPNYSGFHESNHTPFLNGGIIFASSSRKYLSKSTPGTIMMLELMCKIPKDEKPPKTQFWVATNGGDCGSTVGPHLEANLGIRTLDMGNPALSMHSIREMCGTGDVLNAIRVFQLFYENYSGFENWVVAK
jgi:aspartyl aminopeptidase